jgi:hypothetical protein
MTSTTIRMAALASLLALAPLSAAVAGEHDPTGEEKAMISEALLDQGFRDWGKIKFEDGLWEVDDARTHDGSKVDVKLDASFAVVSVDD